MALTVKVTVLDGAMTSLMAEIRVHMDRVEVPEKGALQYSRMRRACQDWGGLRRNRVYGAGQRAGMPPGGVSFRPGLCRGKEGMQRGYRRLAMRSSVEPVAS